MQQHEAEEVSKRIINIWRLTPTRTEWVDYLTPLNAGRAARIVEQLRATIDGALSIARYHAAYHADLADERRHHQRPNVCPECRLAGGDHGYDCPERPLAWNNPLARAAYEAGYAQGQAELHEWRHDEPTYPEEHDHA